MKPILRRFAWKSLCSLALIGLVACAAPSPNQPQVLGGLLDLRGYDFSSGLSVPLTGLWDFLPGSVDIPYEEFEAAHPVLRKVPDLWKGEEGGGRRGHGSGSYHVTILLPAKAPPLSLHYTSASTAFRIEVQGRAVVQVGVPSTDPQSARAAYRPGLVHLDNIPDRLDIMVRVSNYVYRNGGLWYPIFLGSTQAVEAAHTGELAVALVQFTALAVMGLLLLLLFFLRMQERSLLYSSLLSLLLALRILVTGEYIITLVWPGLPFDLMIRMEYLTVYLAFPLATQFFSSLFPALMDRRLKLACILPALAFTALILALPLDALTRSLFAYQIFAFLNIIVLGVTLFLNTVLKANAEGTALFAGAMILAASVVNDVLYSSFVWWTGNLAPWAFGIFLAVQVVILVRRMTVAFAGAEELLAKKELLIKEIHHRVKNSLQVVASLLSLQAHRIADPEIRELFAEFRLRIVSMSLVHEKLYGRVASETLDMGEYLRDLVKLLIFKDKIESGGVALKVEAPSFEASADSCFDAGLIVTELVSNAMKHALLPRGGGSLSLSLSREGETVSILIEDDGPGFPEGFALGQADTLGYKLITNLVKRSRGRLEILPGPGGRVRVELGLGRG
jgi:two-component sensor histidine kinase